MFPDIIEKVAKDVQNVESPHHVEHILFDVSPGTWNSTARLYIPVEAYNGRILVPQL